MNDERPSDEFERYGRAEWLALFGPTAAPAPVSSAGTDRPSPVPAADDLTEVLVPLCRLLETRMAKGRPERSGAGASPGDGVGPFIIGITGGVAVGKSTVARQLADLLGAGERTGPVGLFSTDAYLFSNQELESRGLLARKGFPESYDHHRLATDLAAIRGGRVDVAVPVYSHQIYDIVPDAVQWIRRPPVVVVEGLTVLQEPVGDDAAVRDFLDFAIYVDGDEADVERWFRRRLMDLHAHGDPEAPFFRWFCGLSEEEASAVADRAWSDVNLVNLRQYVAPTRPRADLVLVKGADHRVSQILVRRR